MWRNYLTVGFRALTRSRTYAFINIAGLVLGLAACLLILLYVRHEYSYDGWLPDADRVFQVQSIGADPSDPDRQMMQSAPRPIVDALAREFAEIEAISRSEGGDWVFVKDGEAFTVEGLRLVDEPFFSILQVPFLHGDRATALADLNAIAISRGEAVRLFGRSDVVGETLTRVQDGEKSDFRISGVFEDLPANSHLGFTMVARFREEWPCGWSCVNGSAYVKLKPGVDAAAINARMPAFEERNVTPENVGGTMVSEADRFDWRLVNVRDIHLGEAQDGADTPGNDERTIVTFAIVALLILAMAVVNFTNLATARAGQRAREVALRKVLGANRRQLVAQFLGESMLLTGLAMLIALALVELALPAYAAFIDADLSLDYLGENGVLPWVVGLALAVGLMGGLYPAFFLSRYQPGAVLKANKSAAETPGTGHLRNALVVAQFAISIGLIICTAIVYDQTVFARTSDPGYNREGLLQVEGLLRPQAIPIAETLANEIAGIDGVEAVSGTRIVPGSDQTLYTMVAPRGGTEPRKIGWYSVEPSFFDTMEIEMVSGRALSEAFANDSGFIDYSGMETEEEATTAQAGIARRGINVVLNERAAELLGFADAEAAVGGQFNLSLFGEGGPIVPATIVGIAENSRFRSIREPVEPTIYYDVGYYSRLVVRYDSADPGAVREAIADIWKRLLPDVPLELAYSDEKTGALYEREERRSQTFAAFAVLAIVIACLGLFGLAAFTAERRTKEIGIRKVFGATVRDIVRLLAWQFSKPVILANLIAWPVAWWVMRDWLNGFDARIALTPGPFVVAGLLALAIAVGTIAGHAIKVARANPIHALRYE